MLDRHVRKHEMEHDRIRRVVPLVGGGRMHDQVEFEPVWISESGFVPQKRAVVKAALADRPIGLVERLFQRPLPDHVGVHGLSVHEQIERSRSSENGMDTRELRSPEPGIPVDVGISDDPVRRRDPSGQDDFPG